MVAKGISNITDAATDPKNTFPLAICSLVNLTALALYQNRKKENKNNNDTVKTEKKEDPQNFEEIRNKFIEEKTLLAKDENGVLENGDLNKQSKFMQYAISNLKETGYYIWIPIQDGQGRVIVKRVSDLDIYRDGFKVVKTVEKADGTRVTYDITVLQYPDYNKTEVFHNRMFEYKPGNADNYSPDTYCALYERKNGKTIPDGPTNCNSVKEFLQKAFAASIL